MPSMAWIFVNQQPFYLHDNETLLEGLIRQGYQPAFQCGEGYCGTCKINHQPLTEKSELTYHNEPIFMLNDGEILPCCCHVKGVLHIQNDNLTKTQISTCFDPNDLYDDLLFNS